MSDLTIDIFKIAGAFSFAITFAIFFFLRAKATNIDIAKLLYKMDMKWVSLYFLDIELTGFIGGKFRKGRYLKILEEIRQETYQALARYHQNPPTTSKTTTST